MPPRVGILSTGDEVVPPDQATGPGQVRDINSYALASLVTRAGGEPVSYGIIGDDRACAGGGRGQGLRRVRHRRALCGQLGQLSGPECGGDRRAGQPGVLAHGLSVRPGKPTIIAVCDGVPCLWVAGQSGHRHGDFRPGRDAHDPRCSVRMRRPSSRCRHDWRATSPR